MYSILTTEQFDKWFTSLRDRKTKTLVQVRIDRMEDGNFGDCQPVGNGVSELRITSRRRLQNLFQTLWLGNNCFTGWWRQIFSAKRY